MQKKGNKLEKQQIQFFSLEQNGKVLRDYSKNRTYEQRLNDCFRLTEKAFWREFKNGIPKMDKTKGIKVFKGLPGESLTDFYKRVKEVR